MKEIKGKIKCLNNKLIDAAMKSELEKSAV